MLGLLAVDYCSEKAPARCITMWLPLHHGQEEAEMLFIAPESCILFLILTQIWQMSSMIEQNLYQTLLKIL
jgi:hypothetical protein